MFKLQNKIGLMFVVISLVPLILMAALGIYFINFTQLNSINQLENQVLLQKEKEIENFLNLTQSLLELQLTLPLPTISAMTESSRKFILSEIIKNNKQFFEVSFLDYDAAYLNKNGIGHEITKFNKAGEVFQPDFKDYSNDNGFQNALRGQIFWGEITKYDDIFRVPLFVPVKNTDNVIIGAIRAEVNLESIAKIIFNSSLGNSGYVYLTDNPERIIFSSQKNVIKLSSASKLVVKLTLADQTINIFSKNNGYKNQFSEIVLASSILIKPLNLALIVEWPEKDANSIVYSSIRRSTIFSLLVVIIILIISFFFTKKIVTPIKLLEDGSRIIGSGEFNYSINIKTKDELEELANSFNLMAKNLKEVESLRAAKIKAEALAGSLVKEVELSKTKDKFIATASHQLRTPISVIRWLSEILLTSFGKADFEDTKTTISDLYKNSTHLALIMGDILTVSELGINYQPQHLKEIDLNQLLFIELIKFSKNIDEKKIKINFEKSILPINVLVNEIAMKKVLDNFIDNAITYSQDSGIITIEFSKKNNQVLFSITDQGIGIPENEKSLVFQEFFRASNSVEKKNVGTGLGLFIVKTIINGHNGEVGFKSVQNQGSTFWFSLPIS